jgi:hypothetical protein
VREQLHLDGILVAGGLGCLVREHEAEPGAIP